MVKMEGERKRGGGQVKKAGREEKCTSEYTYHLCQLLQ
jgi:hypothetical protein